MCCRNKTQGAYQSKYIKEDFIEKVTSEQIKEWRVGVIQIKKEK